MTGLLLLEASNWTPAIITGLIGILFGSGGLYAWFKLGPERGQITVNAAQGAVIVHATVLKDIQGQYTAIKEELAQVKMEAATAEQAHEDCRQEIGEMKIQLKYLQRELDRHGRMSELARRKSHLALNTIGSYELLVDNLSTTLRDNKIPITDELRPNSIRSHFQTQMNQLDDLEAAILDQVMTTDPPD